MRLIVIGAGVIGCSVAFECARRGADVRVLDSRAPGQGASQASAGMLAPYIEGHSPELRTLGVRGLAAWAPFLRTLEGAVGALPEHGWRGTVQTAGDDAGVRTLETLAASLAEEGVAHRTAYGTDIRALEPGLASSLRAALEIPAHGYVQPVQLVGALTEAVTRHGGTFVRGRVRAATSGHGAGAPVTVTTEDGRFEADAAVVATGSWTDVAFPQVSDDTPSAVRPVRGQILQLRVARPVASKVLWGPGCYIVPRQDGSVVVGATVEDVGFDERATMRGVRALSAAATAVLPALDDAVFEGVRVGLRPATPDELPIVGPSSRLPNVFFATGHYRSGVLLAPLTARLVAGMVLGEPAEPVSDLLRPARFAM